MEILKIEFLKFRKNTVTIVLLILFAFFTPYILVSLKDIFKSAPPPFPSVSTFYEFPTVWDYQGYVGNWLVSLLLGFLMIHFVTSEVSNKTMRQCIINGWTRMQYWLSKFYLLLFLASLATFLYFASTIIIGLLHTPDTDLELILDNNFATLRFFIMSIGYLSLAFLFAIWIRRGTLTILIYFAYVIFIEQIIRGFHFYNLKNESVLYYPVNIIEDNMPLPVLRAPGNWVSKDYNFNILLPYISAGALTLLLSVIFLFLAYRIIKNKDL